jgi:hypothetical protein
MAAVRWTDGFGFLFCSALGAGDGHEEGEVLERWGHVPEGHGGTHGRMSGRWRNAEMIFFLFLFVLFLFFRLRMASVPGNLMHCLEVILFLFLKIEHG